MLVMKVGQGVHEQRVCSAKGDRGLARDWQPGEKFEIGKPKPCSPHCMHSFIHFTIQLIWLKLVVDY